jgi:hypothetical protein
MFTQVFCPEFAAEGLESLTLNISDDEFEKCHEKLQQMALMTPAHQRALSEAGQWLSDEIIVSEHLLSQLSLTEHHRQVIRQTAGHVEQVKKLLDIISCRPDSAFTQLINSLTLTGQNQVALKLTEYCQDKMSRLPLELLELVLMRTFMKLFNDDYKSHYMTHDAIAAAYSALSAVCSNWWQTLNGWPQSDTKHWLRHQLHRHVQYACHPYSVSPRLQSTLTVSGWVRGVTQCDNKMFVVCLGSDTIQVFGRDNERLTNITVKGLKLPLDIASCTETNQLYIADWSGCVWRVSVDGRQVVKWLTAK